MFSERYDKMPKNEMNIYTQQMRQGVFSERYDKMPKKELKIYTQQPRQTVGYGLDGPGFETQWTQEIYLSSNNIQTGIVDPTGSSSVYTHWGSFPGVKRPEREDQHSPPPTTEVNPLNSELNPICHLLALLGVHHFLHVSRIRVKSLTLRLLMSYIYMEHPFLMFLDHTHRRTTVGRTPLDE